MEKKVLCVGICSVNIPVFPVDGGITENDTTLVEDIGLTTGGDAVNQSIILSRLGNDVMLSSKIAHDEYGAFTCRRLEQDGVDTTGMAYDTVNGTSSCVVLIQKGGRRTFVVNKGAIKTFSFEDIPGRAIRQASVVSIGGLFALPAFDGPGAGQLFRAAKAAGAVTVADTKYDAFGIGYEAIRPMLRHTDYFLPSFDEAAYLSKQQNPEKMAEVFLADGAKNVVIKLGGKGCLIATHEESALVPTFDGPVVDTTGAGDNFMAGFIHGLLRGWPLAECALFGNATGTVCVSRVGATSALANIEQAYAVLEQTAEGRELLQARVHIESN